MANKIRLIPDVGSPLTVVAVDLLAESFVPAQANYADYVMTIGGYLAGFMDWGGDYVKNIGVSSLPLTARKIYERVRGGMGVSRAGMRRVARYPAPASESPFGAARLD